MPEMKGGKKFTGAYGGSPVKVGKAKGKIKGGYAGGEAARKKKIAADVAAAKMKGAPKKKFDAKKAKAQVDAIKKTMHAKGRAKYGGRFGEGNRKM